MNPQLLQTIFNDPISHFSQLPDSIGPLKKIQHYTFPLPQPGAFLHTTSPLTKVATFDSTYRGGTIVLSRSIALDHGNNILMTDVLERAVKVVNPTDGTVVQTLGKNNIRPSCVTTGPTCDIYVTDEKCIKVFCQREGTLLRTIDLPNMCPCKIAATFDGTIIVDDWRERAVHLMRADGTIIKQVYSYDKGHFFTLDIKVNPVSGDFVICDYKRGITLSYHSDGTPSRQLESMSQTSKVAFDGAGYMIGYSYSDRSLRLFSPDGQFINQLTLSETSSIAGIAIDAQGRLVVAEAHGPLTVWQ